MKIPKTLINKIICIKCIFYLFKAFGLATMKINTKLINNNKIEVSFTHSRNGLMYNFIMILIITIFNYINFKDLKNLFDQSHMNEFERSIDTIRMVFSIVCSIIITIKFCFQQQKITKILNRIMSLINSLTINKNRTKIKRISLAYRILLMCLVNSASWIVLIVTIELQTFRGMTYIITKYLCELIINYTVLQYAIISKLVNHLFKSMNDNFYLVVKKSYSSNKVNIIYNDGTFSGSRTKLDNLHDLHLSLCKLSEKISDFYAQPMLLCTLYNFVSLLVYSYNSARPIVTGVFTLPNIVYIHCVCKTFYFFFLLIFLSNSVTGIVLEVRSSLLKVTDE